MEDMGKTLGSFDPKAGATVEPDHPHHNGIGIADAVMAKITPVTAAAMAAIARSIERLELLREGLAANERRLEETLRHRDEQARAEIEAHGRFKMKVDMETAAINEATAKIAAEYKIELPG